MNLETVGPACMLLLGLLSQQVQQRMPFIQSQQLSEGFMQYMW